MTVSLCSDFVLFVVCDVCLLVTACRTCILLHLRSLSGKGSVCPIISYHFYNDHKLLFLF